MDWSIEKKRAALLVLPWSVRTERSPDGYLVATVAELPSIIATGDDEKSLSRELFEAMEALLTASLDNGDNIPLPPGSLVPWENPLLKDEPSRVRVRVAGAAWDVQGTANGDHPVAATSQELVPHAA